jgi:hypothetical protein
LAIDQGSQSLEAQAETLANLGAIYSRAIEHEKIQAPQTDSRSRSGALQRLRTRIASPISGGLASISDQIKAQKEEIEDMEHNIRELEVELDKWSFLHEVSSEAVEYLSAIKAKETKSLERAKSNNVTRIRPYLPRTSTLPPISKVCLGIWSKLFKFTAEEEYWQYIGDCSHNGLRPLVYILSHVCRSWRSAVYDYPALWEVVYVPPAELSLMVERILVISLQKVSKPITLLTNLSHRARNPLHRYIATENSRLFGKRGYTLHLFASSDNDYPLWELPFRIPSNVIITYSGCLGDNFFTSLGIAMGSGMQSLSIIDLNSTHEPLNLYSDKPGSLADQILKEKFPVLRGLKLYHREDSSNAMRQGFGLLRKLLKSRPGLLNSPPGLHTFGVIDWAMPFNPGSAVRNLTSLILYQSRYGWKGIRYFWAPDFNSLIHLEFQGEKCIERDGCEAILESLRDMIRPAPALRSIKFKNCYVEGQSLISILTEAIDPFSCVGWRFLEELTLSDTGGITKIQCDELKTLIDTLHIYVN